jgi:general secretion pathway protein K
VTRRGSEGGAALLAVLAMVALLAGFATVGLNGLRAGVDGQVGRSERAQARLLARSALMVARAGEQAGAPGQPQAFALPGGTAELRFEDGGNCLNLNALGTPGGEGAQALARLLAAVGAGGQALADATALWAAAVQRADPAEWGAMPGVSSEAFARARPFLCALPDREPAALNINTLKPGQEPLLVAAGFAPAYARAAIAARPPGGYGFIGDFWRAATPDGMQPMGRFANAVGTATRWRRVTVAATAGDAAVTLSALLDSRASPANIVAVEWR